MKTILFTLFILISGVVSAQNVTNINNIKLEVDIENTFAKTLDTDSNSTSLIIWVKKSVNSHKHIEHSELIYVIEGEGTMTVDESEFILSPGDYFRIPENTFHSLKVTSKKPMKVLSIQSPEFFGKDRVFEEEVKIEK